MEEREIIALIEQRDERGMEALLRHYGPLLRYVIAPILSDPRDREDCLSETAMRVWDKISQFDGQRGRWSAWLTALARNAARNRARQLRSPLSTEELPETPATSLPSPEELLLQQERQAALRRALETLRPGDRALFYRKYYYLQSTAQIAAELGVTQRAVEGRLYRLKKCLRRMLGGEGYGE